MEISRILERGGYYIKDTSRHGSASLNVMKAGLLLRTGFDGVYKPELSSFNPNTGEFRIVLDAGKELNHKIELAEFLYKNGLPVSCDGSLERRSLEGQISSLQGKLSRLEEAENTIAAILHSSSKE